MTDTKNQIRILKGATEIEQTIIRFVSLFSNLNRNSIKELAYKFAKFAKVISADAGDDSIGFAAFYCNDKESKTAYLSLIATSENMQRRGIGRILINEVQRISAEAGMEKLRLEVNNSNSKAISFYIKNGFELECPAGEHSSYMIKKI